MKKLSLSLLLLVVMISMSGCGSSMYNYVVKPTPIKKGASKYVIRNIDLKLEHGYGRNTENKTFKTESELKNSFKSFIEKALTNSSMLGSGKDFNIDLNINYKRIYNHGGNALNRPHFYYTVKVYDSNNTLLVDYSISKSTTKYSTFKDMAVGTEIAAFQWDAEDEPQDIELISNTLVRELSELGS